MSFFVTLYIMISIFGLPVFSIFNIQYILNIIILFKQHCDH